MYNILIFGTGKTKDEVISGLNENVNILAYLDNDKSKWGKNINGKDILNPEEITKLDYDYVIIASQFNDSIYNQLINMNIPENKIFQNFIFQMYTYNYIKAALGVAVLKEAHHKIYVTGISYASKGISEYELKYDTQKLATFSQDLFYDYHLIKYVIEDKRIDNPKYVIIGLSYYSFEYDLSLSSLKYRCLLYYDAIGVLHHFTDIDNILKVKDFTLDTAHKLFKFDEEDTACIDWMKEKDSLYKLDYEKGKIQAERDCNKDYPQTVKENIKIFDDYIKLLKDNNIKPIVVVFPASKYYTKYFSSRIEDEFKKIIEQRKDKFQYIDYFRSDEFDDSDFFDVSHLNNKGATKFTEILNNIIKW